MSARRWTIIVRAHLAAGERTLRRIRGVTIAPKSPWYFHRVAPPERLLPRALRFVRALIVGGGATLVDVSVLTTCIRVIGLAPTSARLPALLAGASVQFFGNRTYTFRAQRGSMSRQARLFVAVEAITLALNYGTYRVVLPHVTRVPPELVSFFGTFVTFVAFAYPMRKLVIFRIPDDEPRTRT